MRVFVGIVISFSASFWWNPTDIGIAGPEPAKGLLLRRVRDGRKRQR